MYAPALLEENYRLSESGIYYVPSDGPLPSYLKWVQLCTSALQGLACSALPGDVLSQKEGYAVHIISYLSH